MSRHVGETGKVTAVLGPTNTGKTHLALERMLARSSGVMGLPLRLLARELYDKVVKIKGPQAAALITGEEKIRPPKAQYFFCTVEAMPMDLRPAFVGIDEVQLAADPERGHIFTDRLLNARGSEETMFMGSATMRPIIRQLVPEAEIEERERFSVLTYAGSKKLSKLPRRSAVVAFSAEDVYSIAELMRRQRGGSAVVMGALSPRTRNAQVELYQSGEVDFLIATDAIGMGLNMDVDHVAFASLTKFDGRKRRRLFPHEIAQIAGRAGRFRSDGTFGESADAKPLDAETIERVENHEFEPVSRLVWRNSKLDLSSLNALRETLYKGSPNPALERVRSALDEDVLEICVRDPDIRDQVQTRDGLTRLWDVCCTPDFRKTTVDDHARLVKTLFGHLNAKRGRLPETWLDAQLDRLNKTTGDVDALAQRLAHVRTWAYAAHRSSWTSDPQHWQARTREIEDALSDALHERLIARFIDRRTSALMKGLREETDLEAGLSPEGEITVEGHFVGRLTGLSFKADHDGGPLARRAVANAAIRAVRPEVNRRLGALAQCESDTLTLSETGKISWRGDLVAHLAPGSTPLTPSVKLIGGELGAHEAVARAERRLEQYVSEQTKATLTPLIALQEQVNSGDGLNGLARGIGYRLIEAFGAVPRSHLTADLNQLSTAERRQLKAAGVRIGEHGVFMPGLLKPKAAHLVSLLKANHDGDITRALLPPPGLTSIAIEKGYREIDYAAAGFQRCGPRAIRLDILERLADLIREAKQAGQNHAFEPSPAMMSIIGSNGEELRAILKSLGYKRLQKASGEGETAKPELWAGRSRSLNTKRADKPAAPKTDTPFAVLAELPLPAKVKAKAKTQPVKAKPDQTKPAKRRRTRKKAKPQKSANS